MGNSNKEHQSLLEELVQKESWADKATSSILGIADTGNLLSKSNFSLNTLGINDYLASDKISGFEVGEIIALL